MEKHDYVVYSAKEYAVSAGCLGLGFIACDFLTKLIRNSSGFLVF